MSEEEKKTPHVSLGEALLIVVILLACLGGCIIYGQMPPHVPIVLVFGLLSFWGRWKGFSWDDIHGGIVNGITPGIVPLIIFLLIGVLVSSLIAAGTVPTIVVYGYQIISPNHMLISAFLISALVGVTVGSSFTTISTMGIVLMTIGTLMGVNPIYVAGSVVSGAFWANNLSPLADTANLCAALGKLELTDHLKNLLKTCIPTTVITLAIYMMLDGGGKALESNAFDSMVTSLSGSFLISPIALIPVAVILICSWRKLPAIATLLLGVLTSLIIFVVFAPGQGHLQMIPKIVMSGYVSNVGIETVDKLMSRGGLMSMMGSASMIILALGMGGLLVKLEIISTIVKNLEKFVTSLPKLVLSTAIGSIMVNVLIGEQYLSIVLPGETFKPLYKKMEIDSSVMTRTLADAGSAFNSLIPWGVSGTFIVGTLGLQGADYVLYSFYPMILPIMTIIVSIIESKKSRKAQD